MLRCIVRSTVFSVAVAAAASTPSTLSAQASLTNCDAPGVCGSISAFFDAGLLKVRLSNMDNTFGSALFSAELFFTNALAPANLGTAFSRVAAAAPNGATMSIGMIPPDAWFFSGVGGSNELDLAAFRNVFIEGLAPSPFRAAPGDPDNGTWVTGDGGFVEFSADLSSIPGVNNGQIAAVGFCTDQGCVVTPEPATLTLFATGLLSLVAVRRRRKTA
jgi:hypothetical protein